MIAVEPNDVGKMNAIGPKDLFLAFFRIGIQGFGGVLPWARRVLVEEKRWFTEEEFLDAWGLAQALPGGNIINLSISYGQRCAGALGSLAAFAGLTLAPFAVMVMLGILYTRYGQIEGVDGLLRGVAAAGAGLVVGTGLKFAISPRLRSPLALFAVAAFILSAIIKWPLAMILLVLAPLSWWYCWRRTA
ncbi:MAG: chromate transporter [Burkholderiales bacterium]